MPFGPTPPRVAKLNPSTTVMWSNGALFNGFIRFGLVAPTIGGNDVSQLAENAAFEGERVPVNTIIPIIAGKFDTDLGLFYNEDLNPPNSQYVIWYYDLSGNLIAGPSTLFSVNQTSPALPALTLTVPVAGSTIPPSA